MSIYNLQQAFSHSCLRCIVMYTWKQCWRGCLYTCDALLCKLVGSALPLRNDLRLPLCLQEKEKKDDDDANEFVSAVCWRPVSNLPIIQLDHNIYIHCFFLQRSLGNFGHQMVIFLLFHDLTQILDIDLSLSMHLLFGIHCYFILTK